FRCGSRPMRNCILNSANIVVLGNGRVRGIVVAVSDAVRHAPDMVRHLFAKCAKYAQAKRAALTGILASLAASLAEPAAPPAARYRGPFCWSLVPAPVMQARQT